MNQIKKIGIFFACLVCICLFGGSKWMVKGESSIFKLTATPKSEENCVQLSWNAPDTEEEYSYMIYQKDKEREEENYQTIPAKGTVKALQIYPYTNQLVGWVNGYGQGKITCDAVPIETFNANPNIIWNYDVIIFGFWDDNAGKDITSQGVSVVSEYIKKGYGVLFGHDTMYSARVKMFNQLAAYCNVKMAPITSNWQPYSSNGNQITVIKKGLLTNYPYQLGDVGTVLTIPYAHSLGQECLGDIWMTFNNQPNPRYRSYLSTWNNCAMIQTGHSNGAATEDEQKLLMNTLYYLAQKTEATEWEDHMSQDLTGPETPVLHKLDVDTKSQTVTVEMSSKDIGNTYEYYIEATNHATGNKRISNKASAYVEGGLQGYSIVVDQEKETIPDLTVESKSDTYTFSVTNDYVLAEPVYVHIRAIDKFGNGSETIHESFIYTEPICDYDGSLDFLLDEYPTVEIKFVIGTTTVHLSDWKKQFYSSLETRKITADMFDIEFITYQSTDQFMNLLESSAWKENSLRYFIHISDDAAFFHDTALREQVLKRITTEKMHYIGLGKTSVQTQTLQLITENQGRGCYLYSGNISLAVITLTDYLVWNITFPEGSGTAEDPFLLRTGGQLISIRYMPYGYFMLAQDVELHGRDFEGIGDWEHPFTGHFDGNGYAINNVIMDYGSEDYIGVFRVIYQADVQNILLNGVTIYGNNYVGGLVGYAYGSGTVIRGCEAYEVSVQGKSYVGGLAGAISDGVIAECSSFASVYGKMQVGGIAGWAMGSTIRGVFTAATVTGVEEVGGIIGCSQNSLVELCQSAATLVGNKSVGGIVGYQNVDIGTAFSFVPMVSDCKSVANVKGIQYVGGIVGYSDNMPVENCTSESTIEGKSDVGALVGYQAV